MGKRKKELIFLIEEQKKDASRIHVYPQKITPTKPIPFEVIEDTQKRAVFTLRVFKFSYRQMSHILNIDWRTAKAYVVEICALYPQLQKYLKM